MRLSTDKADPGYRDWCIANGDANVIRVFLDGVEQKRVTMADDQLGEVRRMVMTPEGNIAVDKNEGVFLTELVTGKVEIVTTSIA